MVDGAPGARGRQRPILPAEGAPLEIPTVIAVEPFVSRDWAHHGVQVVLANGSVARVVTEYDAAPEADPSYDLSSLQFDTAWTRRLAHALARWLEVPFRELDIPSTPTIVPSFPE